MKSITFLVLLIASNAWAKDCNYTIKKNDLELKWTAYKTPKKVGVTGKFLALGLAKEKTADTLTNLLVGTEFKIDTAKVSSGDEGRDQKIAKFFFSTMEGGPFITGRILAYTKKELKVKLKMNGVEKQVTLKVKDLDNILVANGSIDVLDFTMSKQLSDLTNACFQLHEGKTWPTIDISLKAPYTSKCSN